MHSGGEGLPGAAAVLGPPPQTWSTGENAGDPTVTGTSRCPRRSWGYRGANPSALMPIGMPARAATSCSDADLPESGRAA